MMKNRIAINTRVKMLVAVFFIYAFAKAQQPPSPCYYVAAVNGLNMRSGPGSQHDILEVLPHGTLVRTIGDSPAMAVTMEDEGKQITGSWVQIEVPYSFKQYGDEDIGYVFSGYLTHHLATIPRASLMSFKEISMHDPNYNHEVSAYYSSYGSVGHRDRNCSPRYEFLDYGNMVTKNMGVDPLEFLQQYIEITPIDSVHATGLRKTTGYELSGDFKPEYLTNKKENYLRDYYLPLERGDSLFVQAHTGEYPHDILYMGMIPSKKRYVLAAAFEGMEYIQYSSVDGSVIAHEMPLYNPSHSLNVGYDMPYFISGTHFYIQYLNDAGETTKTLFIHFDDWIIDTELDHNFWISDRTYVMRVAPVDNEDILSQNKPLNWQYIQLSIK